MKTWMIAALLLLVSGCDDQGLPPDDSLKPAARVEFLEASCTEAWLRLAPRNVSPPYTLTLLRNDSAVATLSSPPADTTVIDEGLAPSRTYTYRARLTSPSGLNLTGDPVQARTLDTTSHQFTWETTTLGDAGEGSIFNDVVIVDDTLAYAVGEVYLRDSSGVLETLPYNFAVWNGSTWSPRRVTVPFRGQMITVPLEGVFAHSARDIWLVGGLAIHGDGVSWTPYDVRLITGYNGLSFTKCWGSSSRDMWFTGRVGSLAHFDGSTWRRVASGTTTAIVDIWGWAPSGGKTAEAYCVVGSPFPPAENKVVRLGSGLHLDSIPWDPQRRPSGVWVSSSGRSLYVAAAGGLFRRAGDSWREVDLGGPVFPKSIRGTGTNDLLAGAVSGVLAHFNGSSWRHHSFADQPILEAVAVSPRVAAAVGSGHRGAVFIIGRR